VAASSYDAIPDFGLLYDSVPLYAARQDVAFYVEEAKAARGTLLEVGCGTGRILLPIARAGIPITGIDGSKQMLERCRAKLQGERVELVQHDMRDFDLGAKFDLIIAPFRVIQHLATLDDQLRFLETVVRHLAPGGRPPGPEEDGPEPSGRDVLGALGVLVSSAIIFLFLSNIAYALAASVAAAGAAAGSTGAGAVAAG